MFLQDGYVHCICLCASNATLLMALSSAAAQNAMLLLESCCRYVSTVCGGLSIASHSVTGPVTASDANKKFFIKH
jgi:hypothetical protein